MGKVGNAVCYANAQMHKISHVMCYLETGLLDRPHEENFIENNLAVTKEARNLALGDYWMPHIDMYFNRNSSFYVGVQDCKKCSDQYYEK